MMTIMMMMMITKSLLMIKMPKMTMIMFESFVVVVFLKTIIYTLCVMQLSFLMGKRS